MSLRFQLSSLGLLFSILVGGGCTSYRTWEIDTTSAADFQWNGRVRITERTTQSFSLFGSTSHTETESVELLGRANKNVVVRPSGNNIAGHPLARLETHAQPKDPATQVFAMRLRQFHAELGESTTQPAGEPGQEQKSSEVLNEYFAATEHLRRAEYSQLTTSDAVLAAASVGRSNYTMYPLDDGRSLKAWFDGAQPNSLVAAVLDHDGKVLHQYQPTRLEMVEITPKK